MKEKIKSKPCMLVIITLLFITPYLFAYVVYHYKPDWLLKKTTQHGYLVTPALPSQSIFSFDLKGKWSLLYMLPTKTCETNCKKNLYFLHQLHRALGKDQQRLQLVLITTLKEYDSTLSYQAIAKLYPHLQIKQATQAEMKALYKQTNAILAQQTKNSKNAFKPIHSYKKDMTLKQKQFNSPVISSHLYIVDPLGHLIMIYPHANILKNIYHDLKHLLKVSQIG